MKTNLTQYTAMFAKLLAALIALELADAALAEPAESQQQLILKNKTGAAILGYDPVSYFTDQRPVKGDARYSFTYQGANYLFASAKHRDMFQQNPEAYAPLYGGYCGYAASVNRLSPISPEWWQIVNGRLVLQHNKKAYDLFNKDLSASVANADAHWPELVNRYGVAGGQSLVLTDKRGLALGGFDPVSYFEHQMPVKGKPEIQATYEGALYLFATQANREMFEKAPTRYAPAYGGFCGYAASIGKVRPANPLLWSIVDGQLILQHTKGAVELWEKDVSGNKAKADRLWPRLVSVKAGKKNPVDTLLGKSVLGDVR